ncbi:uncharacterized protein RHOBADRAFT_54122 [Rhodotorula graminis WP1]|uniref:F-box domain-containing protein n=1 Tax=Rhodotorula graminis (strain WP1) TaxID=578459 RepID=A0A194S179_RHOGW|nr:uncharacterized protein RHOBADRAFT_54122 [Rhodotorula graminis WP1]KPV74279.1 hypothetical protein RHOBADRAFT_54122 [Rhodotorula graminis WP1]
MGSVLPDEVLSRILHELHAVAPGQVASLAVVLPTHVRQATLARPVFTSSHGVQQYLTRVHSGDSDIVERARVITIRRGSRRALPAAGKGRRAKGEPVEDAVTPEDLVRLAHTLKRLVELRLVAPAFDSLRRRQVDFAANLPHLRSLSIVGRAGGSSRGFNLHTVGQVLQNAPNVVDLALRHVNSYRGALGDLAPPSCRLSSFALFDTPSITSDQLSWLLQASIDVDSLRTIAFDLSPDVHPSHLAAVKWAATPVNRLAVTSSRPEAVEGIAQHFPSLRQFAFRCSSTVDPHRLLASCASCGSIEVVEDRSLGPADDSASADGGAEPLVWAEALVLARRRRLAGLAGLRRLVLGSHRRAEPGFAVLEEVCRAHGVQLETHEMERGAKSPPFIPIDFAALHSLHLDSCA